MNRAPWCEVVGVSIVALSTALAICGWPEWNDAGSQTAATWVQAAGTLIALGIAIAVPARQRSDESRRRREGMLQQRLDHMRAVCGLVAECLRFVRAVRNDAGGSPHEWSLTISAERGRDLISRARGVALEFLPERYMSAVFDLRSKLFDVVEMLEMAKAGVRPLDTLMLERHCKVVDELNRKATEFYELQASHWNMREDHSWPWTYAHKQTPQQRAKEAPSAKAPSGLR